MVQLSALPLVVVGIYLLSNDLVSGFARIQNVPTRHWMTPFPNVALSDTRLYATSEGHHTRRLRESRRKCTKQLALLGMGLWTGTSLADPGLAAPPIAVIAEELGYFPVTNSENETVYIPKRIKRESTEQAIQLARKLRESGAVMYSAYWCPHCARQRELWGREAYRELRSVECSPKGYNAQPGMCLAKQVDGYPTLILGSGERISGERDLSDLAKEVGYKGFRQDLETNVPPPLGSSACR